MCSKPGLHARRRCRWGSARSSCSDLILSLLELGHPGSYIHWGAHGMVLTSAGRHYTFGERGVLEAVAEDLGEPQVWVAMRRRATWRSGKQQTPFGLAALQLQRNALATFCLRVLGVLRGGAELFRGESTIFTGVTVCFGNGS